MQDPYSTLTLRAIFFFSFSFFTFNKVQFFIIPAFCERAFDSLIHLSNFNPKQTQIAPN